MGKYVEGVDRDYAELLSQQFPVGTMENPVESQDNQIQGSRFETRSLRTQRDMPVNLSTVTFVIF
jgi:hypothetical protein